MNDVADGFYQIVINEDPNFIFRVSTNEDNGARIIAKAKRYGSRDYYKFGLIEDGGIRQTNRWKDKDYNARVMELANMLFDREEAGKAARFYAKSFERCYVCNKPLKDPHSRAAGIGPDCAGTRKQKELSPVDL